MIISEQKKVYPVIAPVAFTTSAVESVYIDADKMNWLTWFVQFGVMTSDTTDTVTLTVECSTAATSNATEVTLPFKYRLSSAVGTDTIGAITAATTTGVAVNAGSHDAIVVEISVDPASIPAALADGRWLRIVATPSAAVAAGVISALFLGDPRYPQNLIPSTHCSRAM